MMSVMCVYLLLGNVKSHIYIVECNVKLMQRQLCYANQRINHIGSPVASLPYFDKHETVFGSFKELVIAMNIEQLKFRINNLQFDYFGRQIRTDFKDSKPITSRKFRILFPQFSVMITASDVQNDRHKRNVSPRRSRLRSKLIKPT